MSWNGNFLGRRGRLTISTKVLAGPSWKHDKVQPSPGTWSTCNLGEVVDRSLDGKHSCVNSTTTVSAIYTPHDTRNIVNGHATSTPPFLRSSSTYRTCNDGLLISNPDCSNGWYLKNNVNHIFVPRPFGRSRITPNSGSSQHTSNNNAACPTSHTSLQDFTALSGHT